MPVLDRPTTPELADGDTDSPREHHIVGTTLAQRKAGLDAWAIVTDAYVHGTTVTALCGFRFVPSRDPEKLPVCPRCDELANR